MIKVFSIIVLSLIIAFKVVAYEEVNYEVVKQNQVYEIRKYSDRLAIETITSNQGSSFRKLFNYISGNNENKEEISMTTPVTQIEKKGSMTMQFYLPSKFNKDNTPRPSNSDIKILNIKGGYYAVIKYSGRASDKNFIKHKDILKNELKKNNILILSSPIKATYDKPFTLPMLRRNEAMFKIDINL
ncbi:SOUL heme-binding protein [Candidatus Pelagibacter ubique]|uniref:SOUL heme-binding protein n=1 Tax=Pelagibacter ubique TaxID=198252 RepID=A0ABX1T1A1_PELUQ|nr:heme-binding protein [Candidatus Pelagibacter ubique]NMN66980.1 SOUL heme-binding protein [Candidatus Pelagibacter ubique]